MARDNPVTYSGTGSLEGLVGSRLSGQVPRENVVGREQQDGSLQAAGVLIWNLERWKEYVVSPSHSHCQGNPPFYMLSTVTSSSFLKTKQTFRKSQVKLQYADWRRFLILPEKWDEDCSSLPGLPFSLHHWEISHPILQYSDGDSSLIHSAGCQPENYLRVKVCLLFISQT